MTDNASSAGQGAAFLFDVFKGVIGVDIETCSAAELSDYGAWAYSLHESTHVWVVSFCYAENGDVGCCWRWYPGDPLPIELVEYLACGGELLAHNAGFEQAIWQNILEPDYGFPALQLDQWLDTQPVGLEANLPMRLEGLASTIGAKVQKDTEGAKLMKKLAKAKPLGDGEYAYPTPTEGELERLALYCDDDVLAMMESWFLLEPLHVTEKQVLALDQRINARGVYLDQTYARKLQRLVKERSDKLADEARRASLFELENAVAPPALKRWLRRRGIPLPTVRKKNKAGQWYDSETTDARALGVILERDNLPADVRQVLEIRQEATKATSLGKLRRVELMVGADGRLRNAFQYCAAGTGRWSSHGIQAHNLPKDRLSPAASGLVSRAVDEGNLGLLEMIADRPLAALSSKLRGVIAAPPGKDLIAADFASIEACVGAWLAGQEDKLEFLHNYFREIARYRRGERADKPQDLYEFTAESIGSDSRQLGKVAELALQYGMGDFKFASTAADWGVPLELKVAAKVKRAWRGTNKQIVDFWRGLEIAAADAVKAPTSVITVGRLRLWCDDRCLYIELPSGRRIRYWRPHLVTTTKTVKFVDKEDNIVEKEMTNPELRFWTQNDAKSGMKLESTYGGKLVENVTQAVARDLLAAAMLRIDPLYPIVAHVHDSIASEVPTGTGDLAEFCYLMSDLPPWALGCPVDSDGYRGKRFRG